VEDKDASLKEILRPKRGKRTLEVEGGGPPSRRDRGGRKDGESFDESEENGPMGFPLQKRACLVDGLSWCKSVLGILQVRKKGNKGLRTKRN